MKIVYLSNSIIPSRTANSIHVMKMCQAFADNGHEVILLAPDRYREYEEGVEDVYQYYGVRKNFALRKLKYSNLRFFRTLKYAFSIYREIKKIQPDLVYGRDLHGCFFASRRFPTMFEAHNPVSNIANRYIFRLMLKNRFYKKTIVISKALKKIFEKNFSSFNNHLVIAHDGSDEVSDFEGILEKSSCLRVGYFGHLYAGRGIDLILAIAEKLNDTEFHIVGGKEKDITYWKNFKPLSNVIFHGFVSPELVYKYRNSCDILLAPYQNEVAISNTKINTSSYMSPLKIFEYMASRKAIVCSDLPVIREVLNETNSILVGCDQLEQWIAAIKKLQKKELRDKLATSAHNEFLRCYTWKIRAYNLLR